MKTCELFNLSNYTWSRIPDMITPRSRFNPVSFNGLIYLCGGYTTAVECFDPRDRTFQPVAVTLPEAFNTTAVVDNNEIVVITAESITRWNVSTKQKTSADHEDYHIWSVGNPVLLGDVVYTVPISVFFGCRAVSAKTGRKHLDIRLKPV